jgi:endonuclease/exonuclease/phosphatase family metal-dependent hydrolase
MAVIRVLTYNVRYFGHATRGLASTAAAMKRIAHALVALDPLPDVVCLQEVETASLRSTLAHPPRRPGETQLARFMEALDLAFAERRKDGHYEAFYFPAHAYRLGSRAHVYTTGLAVLALPTCMVSHHNAGEPHDITHRGLHPVRRLKQTRICAHVRLRHASGETLDVFNTHLSLPSTMSREFWTQPRRLGWGPNQLEEAKNLVRFVEREKKSDRFVIVGDFNALPGSPVHRFLVDEAGYTDAFGRVYELTDEQSARWATAGFMRMRMHLDHVFAGAGVRFLDFEDTHPFGDKTGAFHGLSDHAPLIARLRTKKLEDGKAGRPS